MALVKILISELCPSHITRADGAILRDEIERHWENMLVLDFSGLRIASMSFFDESFGLLAKKYQMELVRKVKVENMNPQDRKILNGIVSKRISEK
jgi:membrane protease subunit (stomatin/prohibitin family)